MYNDFICDRKLLNNELILQYCRDYLSECTGALILDGPKMQTTRMLMANGITDIHCPQRDKDDFEAMKALNLCNVVHCRMKHYISKVMPKEIDCNMCYFDYMGSVEGNKKKREYPLEDMLRFLEKKNKQKKMVFACTFSKRCQGLFMDTKKVEDLVGKHLVPLFTYTQWKIVEPHSQMISYKREKTSASMLFYIFVLEKDETIDTANVIFLTDQKKEYFLGYPKSFGTYII